MTWYEMIYVLPLLVGAFICFSFVALTWVRRQTSGSTAFSWLMFSIGIWLFAYTFELNSLDLASKVFWAKIQYLGIVMLPVAWLVLGLNYSGNKNWLTLSRIFLMIVIPTLTLLIVWTNEFHRLFWKGINIGEGVIFKYLNVSHNWWFWIHAGYSYLLLFLGTLFFITAIIRFPNLYRHQAGILLGGFFLPWVVNSLYVFKFVPKFNFDMTPFAFLLTGLIVAKSFIRFNLLEMAPVARYAVVENMSDLVIVTDLQHRVVDLNPVALNFISHSTTEIIGQPITEIFTAWPQLIEYYQDGNEVEVVFVGDNGELFFDYRVSPLCNHRGRLSGHLVILRDITERKRAEKLESSLGQLQKAMEEIIQAMALIVEMKDSYTAGHQRRVAKLARTIGVKMGLSGLELEGIYLAAVVHDIGKLNIPAEILNKPGKLTMEEFEIIKTHPEVGYNILKTIDFPWAIALMVQQHHEKINGSGYPNGLTGDEILIEARIIAVADVVESMSNDRPYRPALGVDKALEEILRNRGILYDPEVVDVCINLFTLEGYNFEIDSEQNELLMNNPGA